MGHSFGSADTTTHRYVDFSKQPFDNAEKKSLMKHTIFWGKNMSVAKELAESALKLYRAAQPDVVKNIALQAILDQYGLQIGGSDFPWSKALYKYSRDFAHSTTYTSTITRYGDTVSPLQAAFVNGSFAHAQDFDDSHQEAQTHPGSVVIPAAMAMGEHLKLPGNVVLNSIIVGMEIMLRLAHTLCPACIEGGHHTPPTIGPFGAAIACGLLLELNVHQLTNALGICGSYSGGLVEYTLSGGSVKRIHTGLGARAGLEAALLAKEGLTGPTTIIEGKKGLWAVYGRGNAFPERLFDQLGEKYMLATLMFKPYNCCYLIHPAIECFLHICNLHHLSAEDIATVSVGLSKFSISHAGKIILPEDLLGAQFSTSFTLALSLLKGPPGMWSYNEAQLKDQKMLQLAKNISVYEDAQAEKEFPQKNGCILNVKTKNGETYSLRITDPKGSPENLLTLAEIKKKFYDNTVPIIGLEKAAALYERIMRFEDLLSVNDLTRSYTMQKMTARL